jgi:hypothetical protein
MKLTTKFILMIVLAVIILIGYISLSFNDHTYIIEVTDKERVNYSDGGKYLIYGTCNDDTIVLENTDALLRGKFNSSNIYAEIEVGKEYEVTVVGWRIPFLSTYENIIEFKERG